MTWSKNYYPDSMKALDEDVRNKAIEIANSLLKDDYDESRAAVVAISQAKEWASKKTIKQMDGNSQHIVPHRGKWAILREGNDKISYLYKDKNKSLNKAKEIAENENVDIIIHKKDGTIQEE